MERFMHIRSTKFPVLPGEEDELVNEGMFGKALAQYLQEQLRGKGYDVPFFCCEDWGWWVELKGFPFVFGVCIHCGPATSGTMDYVVTDGAPGEKKWQWRRFRFVETGPSVEKLLADLQDIFASDEEVEVVSVTEDFPL